MMVPAGALAVCALLSGHLFNHAESSVRLDWPANAPISLTAQLGHPACTSRRAVNGKAAWAHVGPARSPLGWGSWGAGRRFHSEFERVGRPRHLNAFLHSLRGAASRQAGTAAGYRQQPNWERRPGSSATEKTRRSSSACRAWGGGRWVQCEARGIARNGGLVTWEMQVPVVGVWRGWGIGRGGYC